MNKDKESILTMLASEKTLRKDWDNELDERWNDVLLEGYRVLN